MFVPLHLVVVAEAVAGVGVAKWPKKKRKKIEKKI